jgi:hypothetical protein
MQGDTRGKVSILGGHSYGHSKQNLYMYICPLPNGFRERAVSLYNTRIVDKKETVSSTGIYFSSEEFPAVF